MTQTAPRPTDQPASLTLDEAVARAALLDVERYDVALDLTGLLDGDTLTTTSMITFTCSEPGAATFVDCVAEPVVATLNGAPLDLSTAADGRIPLPALADRNTLVVTSRQSDTGSGRGVLRTVDPSDGLVYVWTTFEPDDARRLWACFDQPDLKAVHAFTVDAPASWLVISNTAPASVTRKTSTDTGQEARTWVFEETPRLSPYVVVVNAGPFHEIRAERGGYDLGLYCRRSLRPLLERDTDELLAVTEHGLAWFGVRFGMPFPQRRYDQIFVPNMGGAMENWGAVTHSDIMLPRSEPTPTDRLQIAEVVLHEMAHMWFGDLVTMRWWDDLWLNEAFATWAAAWAQAAMPAYADVWAALAVGRKRMAYQTDQTAATHPIRGTVPSVADALANFDAITYSKGMSVLRQLHAYVGEDAFLAGLQQYFRDHAWGNTVLEDLMTAVGKAAGRDLSGWTDAWLDHAGTDVVALETDRPGAGQTGGTGGATGTVTVTSPDEHAPRPHRLDVASFADDGTLVAVTELTLDEPVSSVELPDAACHLLNAGDLTFAATRSDAASETWLREHAGRLPDVLSRALAVNGAWDRLFRGELGGAELVDRVCAVLQTERNPYVVGPFLDLASIAAERWTAPAAVEAQRARVAETALGLADDPALRLPALQTLARHAGCDDQFDVVEAAAADDVDLAWRLMARRAELGEYDGDAAEALLARDPDPDAWVSALVARAAAPDPEAKEAVWQAVMVEDRVPRTEALYALGTLFWRPGQRDLLRPYAGRYLAALPELRGSLLSMGVQLTRMYPAAVADEAFLAEARRLEADPSLPDFVRKGLRELDDVLARQLAARAL
ncbi:aminopeptidase N [Nocardioides sp. KR10-350]|uniref:aminopeptidase N n=1 Tax=Nocardioides cheoyonin TaxID=3156615 RepID=UPI0032B5F678